MPMSPVPASPDPESGPPARPATGRRRAPGGPGPLDRLPATTSARARCSSPCPSLSDPTFAGTVVYVLDHSDTRHAGRRPRPAQPGGDPRRPAGLVRSGRRARASSTSAGPARPTPRCASPSRPRRAADEDGALRRVAGDVYLVDLDSDPAELPGELTGLRVFAGYAGWSPGQLAGEIAEGAWACVPGLPDDVLTRVGGPGAVAPGHGPPDRPAGRALHRPSGSVRRTEGAAERSASGRKNPGKGRSGEEAAPSCCLAACAQTPTRPRARRDRPPRPPSSRRPAGEPPRAVVRQRDRHLEVPRPAAASRTG